VLSLDNAVTKYLDIEEWRVKTTPTH